MALSFSSASDCSRSIRFRRTACRWGATFAALAIALGPAVAAADSLSFDLTVEFDDDLIGDYGEVTIEEVAGGLDFSIALTDALGPEPDLHEFYFDWVGPAGLQITADDAPTTAYSLVADPSVAGGAGASFDYGVSFGNGGGRKGNGKLASASFRLEAGTLSLDLDMLGGFFAAHVQSTTLVDNADSETVGNDPSARIVPEATTGILVALGLVTLGSLQPRQRPAKHGAAR